MGLAAQGHQAAALEAAAQGLEQGAPWSRVHLARWMASQAEAAGDAALALRGAEVAFLSSHGLEDYELAQRLAGAR